MQYEEVVKMIKEKQMRRIGAILSVVIMLSAPLTATAKDNDTYISETAQETCIECGEKYGISPELLMAIAEKESSGNRYVVNGSCKGIMQISERWHEKRMAELGVKDIYDERGNILVATDYLAELFEEYEDVSLVLDVYNGNSKAESNYDNGIISKYSKSILERSAELERIHGK